MNSVNRFFAWLGDKLRRLLSAEASKASPNNLIFLGKGRLTSLVPQHYGVDPYEVEWVAQGCEGIVYGLDIAGHPLALKVYRRLLEVETAATSITMSKEFSRLAIGPWVVGGFMSRVQNLNINQWQMGILMERFPWTLDKFLRDRITTNRKDLKNIGGAILRLLQRMAALGWVCTDLHPGNFVVKRKHDKFIVRMIDFSGAYCKQWGTASWFSSLTNGYTAHQQYQTMEDLVKTHVTEVFGAAVCDSLFPN